MRIYIVTTFIGCFAIEDSKIISFKLFPKSPEKIAEKLKLSESKLIEEEKELMKELVKRGYGEIYFSLRKEGVKFVELANKAEQFVKENLRKLAVEYKFVKDQVEFNQLFSKVNIELTKLKIKKAIERDRLVIQMNGAIEEIDKSLNIFVERLREIFGLHFPEMDRIVTNHEKFSKLIEKFGSRENIEEPELKQFAKKSMGMDFREEDIKAVQLFASEIVKLYELKSELTKYLEKILKEVAPNFTEIAGTILAAKLISKAGGIEKLAKIPSSTIQLLGSEKSLFRYLHGKGKPPKYGIIFMHPLIQNSPEKLRGKVARLLASKLSIAAKMDYYSKEYRGVKLKQELQEKVKALARNPF